MCPAGITQTVYAPFVPTSIPGCQLWLRADLGITISTGVSRWADQSGNGNHALQATSGQQPTYLPNGGPTGGPALGFLAVSVQNMKAVYTEVQPVERYIVGMFGTTASGLTLCDGATGGGNTGRILQNSSISWGGYAGTGLNNTSSYTSGNWYAFGCLFNGASASQLFQNGVLASLAANVGTGNPGGIYIGVFGDGVSAPLTGRICEIIDFATILNTSQRTELEAYFNMRYGT